MTKIITPEKKNKSNNNNKKVDISGEQGLRTAEYT